MKNEFIDPNIANSPYPRLYSRTYEKPKTYVITCSKRRFDIKVQKMKRDWSNWFYSFYEGNRR